MSVAIAFETVEAVLLFADLVIATGKHAATTWAKLQMKEAEAITADAIRVEMLNVPTTEELAARFENE